MPEVGWVLVVTHSGQLKYTDDDNYGCNDNFDDNDDKMTNARK